MRIALSGVVIAASLIVAGSAGAGEKPGPNHIEQLIGQLGSKKFAEREAASQALDLVGAAAVSALKSSCTNPDMEIARRAEELVQRIERRMELARLIEPKLVHLSCRDLPIAGVVAELKRQTGYPLQISGDAAQLARRRVTLETGDIPFWEAIRLACHQAGVIERTAPPRNGRENRTVVTPNGQVVQQLLTRNYYSAPAPSEGLILQEGTPLAVPTHLAGAVRFRALPPTPDDRRLGHDVALRLEIAIEPRLVWQGITDVRIETCLDDKGQELKATANPPLSAINSARDVRWLVQNEMPGTADPFAHASIRVRRGLERSQLLKELSGAATCQVQTPPETLLAVEDILNQAGQTAQTVEGISVKLLEVTREASGLVKIRLQQDAAPNGGVVVFNPRGNVVRINNVAMRMGVLPTSSNAISTWSLQDERGQRFRNFDPQVAMVPNNNGVAQELRLTFQPEPGQGAAFKLVQSGRRSVLLEIPFTLKDVAIP